MYLGQFIQPQAAKSQELHTSLGMHGVSRSLESENTGFGEAKSRHASAEKGARDFPRKTLDETDETLDL